MGWIYEQRRDARGGADLELQLHSFQRRTNNRLAYSNVLLAWTSGKSNLLL